MCLRVHMYSPLTYGPGILIKYFIVNRLKDKGKLKEHSMVLKCDYVVRM